ncbi:mycofactocin biosynthesis glycosyltransferase MftF [Rubrobacter indicoceani]|uniref:mycofactocin biosynthesis glycosyltransferase MftF n=1 Tax=Rubrobacter indicoceani TaxID=2051957 RepID=UPI000E5A5583|nr:mycofactocin biosynthesis glycosyltransferase MftF [Rubrobacter indicoceani]
MKPGSRRTIALSARSRKVAGSFGDPGRDPRELWEAALLLPPHTDLETSLVAELAEYLGASTHEEVAKRCAEGAERVSREWVEAAPTGAGETREFYRKTDAYLYDLTRWHSLAEDGSALSAVGALDAALGHRAQKTLDFGGGIGSLGLLLADNGLDVTLADINPVLNDYARSRFERRDIPVKILETGYRGLPEGEFDFVSAVDVLEHLPDPGPALKSLAAALKPGGTLFVHLPPEKDRSRPMHLWHGSKALLRHIEEAGLWLEGLDKASLTLRRGPAPRYSLSPGMEVRRTDRGWALLSERPLMATEVNARAAELLKGLDGGKTATELSEESGLAVDAAAAFLDGLAARRIVGRDAEIIPARLPSVTAIVPAKDRPLQTRACVESLVGLDYPADLLEVLVVDDASEYPLLWSLSDLPVRVLRLEKNVGQSAARNLAAAEAGGEILAFTDNDCEAESGWLRSLVARLSEPGTVVVGGRILSSAPDGPVAAFEAVRSSLDMGEQAGRVGFGEPVAYLPTCNLAVDREAFLRLGGFDEEMSLGEDADFVWRVLESGGDAYYEPEAGVVHHHRTHLPELLRRRSDYASSEADLQHRHEKSRRGLVIPTLGTLLLALVPAFFVAWQLGLLLGLMIFVMLAVEFATKQSRLRRAGVTLPVRSLVAAITRQHGAGLYHLGANVCRYYSLPLLAASAIFPPLLPSLLVVMSVPPVVDHRRLKPETGLITFVLLCWLELSAYQVGVWRGCLERRTVRPLLAKVNFSR